MYNDDYFPLIALSKEKRMRNVGAFYYLLIMGLFLSLSGTLVGQDQQAEEKNIATTESIQVTATKVPEAVDPEPASISIVTREELQATGANDLAHALALVTGVSIGLGGDGGPASSVPELWGLREFDAFLLVVDDVPWGGAFNPDLATLDLNDIERIEILRGPAPVMYGATSFVGVIHVIHRAASSPGSTVHAYGGNYSTGGGAARITLPSNETWKHAISMNFDQQGYRDNRSKYDRGHVLYRGETNAGAGRLRLDADLTFLSQDPASPHPRSGGGLDPNVPIDANHNPSDSQQDENRYHFVGGYNQQVLGADWAVLAALTHATRDITKGFLTEVSDSADPNTAGFRQNQDETDLYLDTHFAWATKHNVHLIFGADHLYGKGEARSENFDYFVNLNGSEAPSSVSQLVQERPQLEDTRNFFGLYGQMEWAPTLRWLVQGGLRFNSTHEKRHGEVLPGDPSGAVQEPEDAGTDKRTENRVSGVVGVSYLAYTDARNHVWVFADYRDAFKPAAIDFGPEAEGEILEPETARSIEAGLKGRIFENRLDWEISFSRMNFENLVTATVVDGLPALINSGKERFSGVELETELRIPSDFRLKFAYSNHSAKFRDFVQAFDGVPTQLSGKKLEMSPDHLAAFGVLYRPSKGVNGSFLLNYIGDRFLNKRNTALAKWFVTIALGAGYQFGPANVRFDIENLTNRRDPISESELGDAQYYRLPARNFRFGVQYAF